ncbi:unnamed protein product [Cuscuta campestris]|uniref:Uncharacterized protein n=1 Tax=Cuscuta campestris TaxID=132261 RepID=A0A484L260_9ASTE|nr:unnamed protein product [Cuscuta campestris]
MNSKPSLNTKKRVQIFYISARISCKKCKICILHSKNQLTSPKITFQNAELFISIQKSAVNNAYISTFSLKDRLFTCAKKYDFIVQLLIVQVVISEPNL